MVASRSATSGEGGDDGGVEAARRFARGELLIHGLNLLQGKERIEPGHRGAQRVGHLLRRQRGAQNNESVEAALIRGRELPVHTCHLLGGSVDLLLVRSIERVHLGVLDDANNGDPGGFRFRRTYPKPPADSVSLRPEAIGQFLVHQRDERRTLFVIGIE